MFDAHIPSITRREFLHQAAALAVLSRTAYSNDSELDFQIGQMIMTNFPGFEVTEQSEIVRIIQREHLGGVLLFELNFASAKIPKLSLEKLTKSLQHYSSVPLLIAMDQEGGSVNRLKEKYGFPATCSAQQLGQFNDPALTYHYAQDMAAALADVDVNMNLAPVVDLRINPTNPVVGTTGRCFSSDADIVVRHAAEFIRAHHEHGLVTTLKHFPGHGSSTDDSHQGFTDVSDTWSVRELVPYQQLIAENLADTIMPAHIYNHRLDPYHPASLSYNSITGLLREKMGFQGVVISDDLLMGAVNQRYSLEETVALCLQAGADVLLFSSLEGHLVQRVKTIIKGLLDQGELTRQRICKSAKRIQTLKGKLT